MIKRLQSDIFQEIVSPEKEYDLQMKLWLFGLFHANNKDFI
jgi:hypothetical protein